MVTGQLPVLFANLLNRTTDGATVSVRKRVTLRSFVSTTTCCIITGLFISLKKHCENVSEKEPIFADEGATVRALLKNKKSKKYV
jgi:hypothetical protein